MNAKIHFFCFFAKEIWLKVQYTGTLHTTGHHGTAHYKQVSPLHYRARQTRAKPFFNIYTALFLNKRKRTRIFREMPRHAASITQHADTQQYTHHRNIR